jgi:outer membrane protein OmpA-like peptidoglycan-associated protein/tetratricopeptide (TPR) repeat protein
MKLLKYYILFFAAASVMSGCLSIRLRTANENYQQFAYAEAIKDYEWVLQKRKVDEAVIPLAESYRLTGNPVKAEYWYRRAIKLPDVQPKWKYYLAVALMENGKYSEAKQYFSEYLELNRNDFKAQRLMASCDSVSQFYVDTTLYTLQPLRFNGLGENNFSPAFYRSGIVFLSDKGFKGLSKSKSEWTGKRYLDLFYAQRTDRGNWIDPEPLRGDINGRFNEGPAVFTHDYQTIYFTRNNYISSKVEKNKKNVNVLKIYKAHTEAGTWKIDEPLAFNSEDYSICHPAINSDGTIIYFASDIPWGYGGMDIYMVRWQGGNVWSQPVNLGPEVNTDGNEVFPFMQNDTTIYFSSDGHIGMGGLDVFVAHKTGDDWKEIENLNAPVNSSRDDFGFIVDSLDRSGYFSTNRIAGNDKIVSFTKNLPHLTANINISGSDLSNSSQTTEIVVYKDGKRDTVVNIMGLGRVSIHLGFNHDYEFALDNKEFYAQRVSVSTKGRRLSQNIPVNVVLKRVDIGKPVVFRGIDFKKKDWQLKVESSDSLESLVQLLQVNPRLQVEIGSYTDSRGGDADNIKLTQKRAEIVMQYLGARGVKSDRMTAKGYGEAKLLNKCVNNILCLEEDHQVNNRIEVVVKSISKNAPVP